MSWREISPRPSGLWIRWVARRTAPAPGPRLDLGGRRLIWPGPAPDRPSPPVGAPATADLAYCPATSVGAEELAPRLAALVAAGCPALVHLAAGERRDDLPADAIVVWDLLEALLDDDPVLARLEPDSPPGAAKLWIVVPLIAGATPVGARLRETLVGLQRFEAEAVVGLAPELTPADRRRLSERLGEERYEEVFHGRPPSERAFAAAARAAGLDWRPPRPPLAGQTPRLARNREIAAVLAEAAELWLRLGRDEPEGFALAAAARHVDAISLDLVALAREGNLDVLGWLSPVARSAVVELCEGGRSSLLEELVASWAEPAEGSVP